MNKIERVISKYYRALFEFAKVWRFLFFQRKNTSMNNNSVLPGLRKREAGAPQLHVLEKYTSCLLQTEIKLPRIYRTAVVIDDLKYWSVAKRMYCKPHRNWQEISPRAGITHSRRLGILDLWQPNFIILLCRKSYPSERTVRKILYKNLVTIPI